MVFWDKKKRFGIFGYKDDNDGYEKFGVLAEQLFLPILVIDNGYVRYANHAFYSMAGIPAPKKYPVPLRSLLYSIPYESLRGVLAQYNENNRDVDKNYSIPIMIPTKDGMKWIELYSARINHDDTSAVFITFLNITEKIIAEKEIRYLAYHDKLTGLYNRGFFEEEVNRIDVERSLPISIIISDLNGLKLTNDVFGHLQGDKLLTKFAEILKRVCRKEDVVARWGGDEFAVLLPGTDNETAGRICERIRKESIAEKNVPIALSISMGYATKYNTSESLIDVLKMAENMMYREKLSESRKIRQAILNSLKESLFQRSIETENHLKRVTTLSKEFADYIGLSEKDIEELTLLAYLHDIGKVAIPDDILMKAGKLNHDEWLEVRTHSEKGYKIAVNHQELAHISDGILCHHERWDGKGYPQGLREKDIPRISRILNIVDAYDIMTHNTVYKNAISHEDAIDEIINCSGKQFDPYYAREFVKFMERA
ncbi:MAG: diguanylate cyclase [Clostridiaceae bacterium]|nr:diguanylate cyclase [Clostridiaceae bacterium]